MSSWKEWFICLIVCCGAMEARCKEQKMAPGMSAGYSAPAWVLKDRTWDGFIGASFLYWHSNEDGLSIGRRIPANRTAAAPLLNEKILLQEFSYKPGFKVFAGFGCSSFDNWKFLAEWTHLHQTTHTHYAFDGTTQAILLESWVHLLNENTFANQVNSSWKLRFDLFDVAAMRPYYSGKQLTVIPLLGLRTAWIDQDFSITYRFLNTTPMNGNFQSDSWGIGPLVGLVSNWGLGSGFSILGKATASLLYTDYTKLTLFETINKTGFAASGVNANYGPYHTVRPNAGLGLGLSWSRYLYNKRYLLAFAAAYDFNVFWYQNMLRGISDNYSFGGSEAGTSSLNLHGLTATASFTF